MAKLVWDKSGERFFEAGVKYGVLYPMKTTHTENETTKYEAGVVWNGLTGVTETPEGAEPNDLWADNMKYATLRSEESFNFGIEAYMYPEEFAVCDGSYAYADGVLAGQQKRKAFGFCFRTEVGSDEHSGIDAGYKLHIIWNATASPSERSYETINDSPDAITFSWDCTTTPVVVTAKDSANKVLKPLNEIIIDSTKADADKLAALEAILYGSDGTGGATGTDARLPDPDEVLSTMA